MTVKLHLSELLEKHNMTLEELVSKTGIELETIQELFDETVEEINLQDLEKICRVLECHVSDLIESK